MRSSVLAVSTLFAATSVVADFTWNTTFMSDNNGQLRNPYQLWKQHGATGECLTAYAANIQCDPILSNLIYLGSETTQTKANLEKACTPTCERSMAEWIEGLWTACKDQPDILAQTSEDEFMDMYYRVWCAQDLTSGEYCLTQQNGVYLEKGDTNKADIEAACKDSCFLQTSALLWSVNEPLNKTETINVEDARKVCPNVDFASYEILAPVSEIASGSFSSTSSVGSSSSTTAPSSTTATSAVATTTSSGSKTTSTNVVSSQTSTGAGAATKTPNDASAIVRGVMPVAWAALAMAVAMAL